MTCLACGGTTLTPWARARDVEYASVPGTFSYVRCEACEALSIDPVPSDQLAVIYPSSYYSFDDACGGGVVQGIKDALDRRWFRGATRELPDRPLRALDVGGGTGRQLDALRSADPRVTRTVIAELDAAAEPAARRRGHEFVHGRFEDARVEGPFDIVLMLNLIEHVRDPLAVLRRARALLAPDGIILIKTPNYDSLDARVFRHRNWGGYHCPRHWVIFNRTSLESLVRHADLSVAGLRYTQGAPFWAVSMLGLLADRGMTRVTRERPAHRHPLYAPLSAAFAALDFARAPFAPLSQMILALRPA